MFLYDEVGGNLSTAVLHCLGWWCLMVSHSNSQCRFYMYVVKTKVHIHVVVCMYEVHRVGTTTNECVIDISLVFSLSVTPSSGYLC